ncbi:MAG: DUF1028 domain-containing protein [bacterium]|jgi:uncharacterized Ntn-hydrolase superfamily protein
MNGLYFRPAIAAAAAAVLLCANAFAATQCGAPNIATFSVVAYDPSTGEVGVAVQSKFFAVGSVVPWCRAGVGAVASQAYGNPTFGPLGLDMIAQGKMPEEVLKALLETDEDAARRQIGIVALLPDAGGALRGFAGTYTGDECLAWAGGKIGKTPDGITFAVQGNILSGPEVVEAMAAAISLPADMPADEFAFGMPNGMKLTENELAAVGTGDLAGRLLRALLAGQAAGGDSRGMQSAALKVSQAGAGYGGYTDVKYDLRVDDAADPFDELARLLNLARPISLSFEAYNKLYAKEYGAAIEIFTRLVSLQPEEASHHYNLACALSLSGSLDEAMKELAIALEMDPDELLPLAKEDHDLDPLREREDFRGLVG